MKLYIIRHADPDYENNTITDFGWEEAHALAQWLKDVHIDKIYTSPLGRAIDTAKPTCEIKGMTSEILPWTAEHIDYMRDNNLTPESECTYSYSIQNGIYDYKDFSSPERMKTVENMQKCSDEFLASLGYEREGALYKVTRENNDAIAVFCHGGFGGAWITYLMGNAPGNYWQTISLSTSSVTTFAFHNYSKTGYIRPILCRLGEIKHIYDAGLRVNTR
jgi:probable phosphoglycerate mutase